MTNRVDPPSNADEPRWVRPVLTLLILIGMGLAADALYAEHRLQQGLSGGALCTAVPGSNCDAVLSSDYAQWFGIPLPVYALAYYGALLILTVGRFRPHLRRGLITLGVFFACLLSVGLFYITRTILHAVCPICYAMYGVHFLLLLTVLMAWGSPVRVIKNAWFEHALFRFSTVGSVLILVLFGITGRSGETSQWKEWNPTKTPSTISQAEMFYTNLESIGRARLQPGTCTPLYGDPAAPLKMWEFSDFQCPWCRRMALTLKSLVNQFGPDLYIEYCHYPLDSRCNPKIQSSVHPYACELALLAECAALRGQFRRVHDEIFQNQDKIEDWLAGRVPTRVNLRDLRACTAESDVLDRVQRQIALGEMLNVTGTPTLFLNGLRLSEAPVNLFPELLRLELKRIQSGAP